MIACEYVEKIRVLKILRVSVAASLNLNFLSVKEMLEFKVGCDVEREYQGCYEDAKA